LRHRFAHRAEVRELGGAASACRQVRFDVAGMTGIELAVDERMNEDFGVSAVHVVDPSSTRHAVRNIERPRASRDITVPTGTPTTSAISR